ncbi:MAG TPA: histidine kinase dimerization/phospho-acceptor domain-containing protein [Terriglobales bacterium]|jgi:hypothetical protein
MSAIVQLETARDRGPEPEILIAALEACPEGLAILESGRVLYANQAFARSSGYRHGSQVQGRAMADIGKDCSLAACTAFRAAGRDLIVLSVRNIEQHGPEGSAEQDSQGVEAVGRLVSGVAHDFNNLITGILLYCDLLLASLQNNDRLRHHVEEMRAASEQGGLLIQQLLSIARHETSAVHAISWNVAVLGMQNFLQRVMGEHIELVSDLGGDIGLVKISPAEMQQVILNLVLNARDAMPDGGASHSRHARLQEFPDARWLSSVFAIPAVALPATSASVCLSRFSQPNSQATAMVWVCPPCGRSFPREAGRWKSRANQEKAPRLWFAFPQSDRSNFINLNRRRGNSS